MFSDKKPSKYLILGILLILIAIGIVLFFGMRAQAAGDKFLDIREIKTPSGLTVWHVEDHSLPIIAVRFFFMDAGAARDPDDKQGLARMVSNTMDEGAGDLDSQAFQKALSDHSITLLFDAPRDGFGGELKTLSRHKDKAFELLELAINKPRFDTEPVARMRDGNISRIKSSLSEPEWMAARLLNDRAFEGHPYAKNSGGTLTSLTAITPEDLRAFKEAHLTRDRLLIAAAGDIKADELAAAMDKVFSSLPAKASSPALPDTKISNGGKVYTYAQDIPQTMIEIMLPAFGEQDPDHYALEVMNYIYGGAGFGSRLMEEAREKQGLTYGIYSGVQNMSHTDVFSISTSTKNESAQTMLSIVRQEMERMKKEFVSDKELQDAKSYITGSMPLSLGSTENIAENVLSLRIHGLPIDYLDRFAEKIRAVTPADVQRAAQRVLIPEKAVTILVGKPEGVEQVEVVKELPNVQ